MKCNETDNKLGMKIREQPMGRAENEILNSKKPA